MKRFTLALAIALTAYLPLMAQPTLTSSVMNPVPTEVFYGHQCDPTSVTPGAAGAAVTWNYASLTETGLDTTTWVACGPSVHCDSFPGSNIVMYDNYNYYYCKEDTSKLVILGAETSGLFIHAQGEQMLLYYPLTYGSARVDSFYYTIPALESYREIDSFICDGYGTLTLPSGTYTNVMRVHEIAYVWDTAAGSSPYMYRTENYNWYMSGFHYELLTISVDTSMPGGPYTSNAEYYTQNLTLGVQQPSKHMNVELYPNPATNAVHVKFYIASNSNASVTLSDVTGRAITTVGSDKIQPGYNELDIPVSGIPAGVYVVHVSNGTETAYKKVSVVK